MIRRSSIIVFLFLMSWTFGKSQDIKKITDIIKEDYYAMEFIFHDNIFLSKLEYIENDINFERTIINKINFGFVNHFKLIVYEASIPIKKYTLMDSRWSDKDIDTLNYCILSVSGQLYRIFGFYTTDIAHFRVEHGDMAFITFVKRMQDEEILTKKQSRRFKKNIFHREPFIDQVVFKPCEILRLIYKEEKIKHCEICTIILPTKPLIKIRY